MIAGPRQSGKTTLAKSLSDSKWQYYTFDDSTQFESAKKDPLGFINQISELGPKAILDEVQRVPEIFVCIKQSVDELRTPGRFLLTGSCNAMLLPRLSDSLAGRLETIPILPLSECELRNKKSTFIDKLLNQKAPQPSETRIRKLLIEKIVAGGFPEPLARRTSQRRAAWYREFINSLVQKDLKDISNIEHLEIIPRLLRALAIQTGQLMNVANVSEKIPLSPQTTERYITLLTQLFLIDRLPAWHSNENKRLIKAPKLHFVDTGLVCALRSITSEKILHNPEQLYGHLLENYVYTELKKQSTWLDEEVIFSHYRDKDKVEVDIVIETLDGKVMGIEVTGSATIRNEDFKGLERLKNSTKNFHIGIILYDGDKTTAFGENMYAVPLSALW